MRLDELAGPVEGDVIGEMLAEAGPLAPDAKTREVKDWMATVADRIKELDTVDRERASFRVVRALEQVEWLAEVCWGRSMMPPYFKLAAVPKHEPAYVAPRERI